MRPQPYQPVSYLEWNAERNPDAPAIWDSSRTITFSELRELVHGAAAALARAGVGHGSVVAVQLPNVWEYVVLELAIPYLGAVIVPLPLVLEQREVAFVVERARPRLIVHDPAVSTAGQTGVTTVTPAELLAERSAAPVAAAADPDRIVEIALTSGTTGPPKLAALSAGLKQVTFESFTSRLEVTPEDRVLIMSPLTQGIGGMCLYCLRVGAALVMLREPRWRPEHTLATAAAARATMLVGVPTNVIRLLASAELDPARLDSLRVTAVAGAPMPPEVAKAWERATGSRVCVFYGSMDAGQLAVASPSDPEEKRWTTVGRPHDRAEWVILRPDGTPAGAGETGEICMRGPLVQSHYWAEAQGPLAADNWAHMGDLGFVDEGGFLHVVGRVKDIIIRGGTNINPFEVESVLRGHPAVLDACVVGRPDPQLGEVPVAFLVCRPGHGIDVGALRAFLADQGLAHFKWPVEVQVLDELPLSGPGKVNRGQLRSQAAEGGSPALSLP